MEQVNLNGELWGVVQIPVPVKPKLTHKILRFSDLVYTRKINGETVQVGTKLDRNLRRFLKHGIRILNFWRENGKWAVKVMNRR